MFYLKIQNCEPGSRSQHPAWLSALVRCDPRAQARNVRHLMKGEGAWKSPYLKGGYRRPHVHVYVHRRVTCVLADALHLELCPVKCSASGNS